MVIRIPFTKEILAAHNLLLSHHNLKCYQKIVLRHTRYHLYFLSYYLKTIATETQNVNLNLNQILLSFFLLKNEYCTLKVSDNPQTLIKFDVSFLLSLRARLLD
jgi:hypothetical protein